MCVFSDDRMECGTRKAFGPASADISAVLGDLLADGDREKPLILDGLYLALYFLSIPLLQLRGLRRNHIAECSQTELGRADWSVD